jgi:hypothetical protein
MDWQALVTCISCGHQHHVKNGKWGRCEMSLVTLAKCQCKKLHPDPVFRKFADAPTKGTDEQ